MEKGINYILSKSFNKEIKDISEIKKLKDQFIPLDHLSTSITNNSILEKRKENRNKRKHYWKSLGTRSFRKKQQKLIKKTITFDSIEPLNNLWNEYSSRIAENESLVSKMDLHGANIKVISSPDPSIVGLEGRIIKETYGSIILVSKDNIVRQINKIHTLIILNSNYGQYEINLSAILGRPYQRTTKKWKSRFPTLLPF